MARGYTTGRRHLARRAVHGHWVSQGLLPQVSLLSLILSADGAGALSERFCEASLTIEDAMRFPLSLTLSMAGYIVKNKLARRKRFPLVLMLEPLHACNLTCT